MQGLGAGNDPTQPIVRHYCHQALGHTEQSNPVGSFTAQTGKDQTSPGSFIFLKIFLPAVGVQLIPDLEFFLIPTLVSPVCILLLPLH